VKLLAFLFLAAVPCDDPNTIVVTGTGTALIVPDRVSFTVGVVTSSASVATAFQSNNEKTNAIVRALKRRQVRDTEIQTSNFSVDSPWDPETQRKSSRVYVVTNSVTVTREDPKAVSELIQAAIDAGANSASNLTFFNSNPAAARDRAIELAVRDARAQAEKLATSVGRGVGAALQISTTFVPRMPGWRNNAVSEAITVTAAAPTIEAGTNEVTYSVTVTWELK
jgi:uncharacterized protein